ncbi:MAG: tetratricopeptide repeat protein, partial [Bacteroidia bacterium]|nr:tetratricopeptide repeat protein [Bacteroidia bacterium]
MKHRTTFILAALLAVVLTASGFQDSPQYKILFEKAKFTMETKGDLNGAITLFNEIIKKYPKEREYAAKSQLNIGLCYEKLGANQAQKAYQTVVDTWPDQTEMVALAKTKLTQLTGVVAESNLRAEQSFKLAGDLYKEFKYESAVAEYEKVIKMAPKSKLAEEAQLWIGQCYFKEGKNDQALASFNTIKKDYPQSTIVPVTELMISQVKQAIATKPNRKPIVTLDDKTILDPATGIRYTRINTLAGKNDVITSASTITAISPNRKFVLVKNKVIPFGTGDSFEVFDFPASGWLTSELSPDGTRIAYLTENSISVISISPETGRPAGPGKILVSGKYNQSDLFSWSPDGEKLVLSLGVSNGISNLWTLSTRDSELKQITNGKSIDWAPLFAKNGKNILFKRFTNIIMRPAEGFRSVIIADSCASYYHEFYLSPNNQWIIYPDNDWKNSFSLFRVGDKQKQDLSFPQEVGDIVSWTNQDKKVYFFSPSTEYNESLEVVSVMGGPA